MPVEVILMRSVLFVFVTKSLASMVPIKLVPAVVPLLPVFNHAFAEMAGVRSNALEAIPLTVEVILSPLNDNAFVLIMFTPAPVTPFTVVFKVLAEDVLLTLLTASDVAAIPLTVEVSVLPDKDNALELIIFTPAPVTPFTVVLKVFVAEELLTVVAPV